MNPGEDQENTVNRGQGGAAEPEPLFGDHPRSWHENRYVYPVISRRSGGLSVGVNLNPDKVCNFDCVYCQVDRSLPAAVRKVDCGLLRQELERTIGAVVSGELFVGPPFGRVPADLRQFKDIAFSGDGEPTACPQFLDAVRIAADLRRKYGLDQVKLVLITDAAYLARPAVREALAVMDANNGEIWAKLDAGTESYFRSINRPNVSLQVVVDNILDAARVRPIVIQSLWMKVHDSPPPDEEVEAFARRLAWVLANGGQIRLVQIYTIARRPAEPFVAPLNAPALQAIAEGVTAIASVPISTYGG